MTCVHAGKEERTEQRWEGRGGRWSQKEEQMEEFVDSTKDWGCIQSMKKVHPNLCFCPSKCKKEEEQGLHVVERSKES